MEAFALVEMQPDVFLRTTTPWGEPKVAFRLAAIDAGHLAELVTEAWRVQAPKYLRLELDVAVHDTRAADTEMGHDDAGSGEDLDVQSAEPNLPE